MSAAELLSARQADIEIHTSCSTEEDTGCSVDRAAFYEGLFPGGDFHLSPGASGVRSAGEIHDVR